MTKVTISDLPKYKDKILARDVFYNGKLLFQNNSIINDSLIKRLNELKDYIFYVFVYENNSKSNQLNDSFTKIIGKEIITIIENEKKTVLDKYQIKEDSAVIEQIIDIFFNQILTQRYFKNYLENLLITNNIVFEHSIREKEQF